MSTHSSITAKCKDGKFRSIYCQFDGYLEHVGKVLFEHFQDQQKIEDMMSLGDMSSIEASIECSVFYKRDRGENDVDCCVCDSKDECFEQNDQAYNYFWDGEKWFVDEKELKIELESVINYNCFNGDLQMNDPQNTNVAVAVTDTLNNKVVILIASMTDMDEIFTAFDVTEKIRLVNPGMDVPHQDVKEMVLELYKSDFCDNYDSKCVDLITGDRAYVYYPENASPYDHPKAVAFGTSTNASPATNIDPAANTDTDLTVEKRLNIPKEDLEKLGLVAGKQVRIDVDTDKGVLSLTEAASSPYETLMVNSDGRLRLNAKTLTNAFGCLPDKYEITCSDDNMTIIVKAK